MQNNTHTEFETSQELKAFVSFLKAEKLREIIEDVIRLSYEYQLPAMKQLEGVMHETIYNLTSIGLIDFFNDIQEGKPIQGLIKALDDWTNKRIGQEITSLSYNDVVTGYLIRKQVLVKRISSYTDDPMVYINLVRELNNLMAKVEEVTLRVLAIAK